MFGNTFTEGYGGIKNLIKPDDMMILQKNINLNKYILNLFVNLIKISNNFNDFPIYRSVFQH